MAVINRISEFGPDMTEWRRHLHAHPELGFETKETAAFVAARLRDFGITEIHEGIAKNGIVALVRGRGEGRVVGLRADMDALPMQEMRDPPYRSTVDGRMHACGHDGHTTMLLGAARYLAETRNFDGTVALIFQPAEEGEGGGRVMVEEGIMDRFGIEEVYAIHNWPNHEVGAIATRNGAIMAATDTFSITLAGHGGHAALPHLAQDMVQAAVMLAQALQQIAARRVDPVGQVVLSVTKINAGTAFNILPGKAELHGTVRTLDEEIRSNVEKEICRIAQGIAAVFDAKLDLAYRRGYPVTVNHADAVAFAADVAEEVVGKERVERDKAPAMGGEDFAYMLQARKGAYLFLGAGEGAPLHHPEYDFNDEIAPIGASFLARVAERALG